MVDIFSEFVHENISRIMNAAHPPHPLNNINIGKWVNRHEEVKIHNDSSITWRDVARIVSNLFKNVSWDEYCDLVNKIANELGMYTRTRERKRNLYLLIPNNMKKSNFFATVMFFHVFCHVQGHEFSGIVGYSLDLPNDSIIVIVDDASYSGTQMVGHINAMSVVNPKVVFYVAVPCISKIAKICIQKDNESRIIFPKSAIIFDNLETYIQPQHIQDDSLLEVCSSFKRQHFLYLDFKLPDNVSILDTILAYGYTLPRFVEARRILKVAYRTAIDNRRVPDVDRTYKYKKNETLCLIQGCGKWYRNNIQDVLNSNARLCPYPFYHRLKYTFRHVKIKNDDFFNVIGIQPIGKQLLKLLQDSNNLDKVLTVLHHHNSLIPETGKIYYRMAEILKTTDPERSKEYRIEAIDFDTYDILHTLPKINNRHAIHSRT